MNRHRSSRPARARLQKDVGLITAPQNTLGRRVVTAAVWAGVAGSAWYWSQLVLATPTRPTVDVSPAVATSVIGGPAALARLLGASSLSAADPGPAGRFALAGVIASSSGEGAALIAVDGKPARPFAVGAQVAPGFVLESVGYREARLTEGPDAPAPAILLVPSPGATTELALAAVVASEAALSVASPATQPMISAGPPPRLDSRHPPSMPSRR